MKIVIRGTSFTSPDSYLYKSPLQAQLSKIDNRFVINMQ
ncbi:hypothetical protein M077_3711 [Bacteroides fragilis str. 2-F-2 |nr:hypothetical protein M077_3711 [Bacteroides fragilis str. 2-F-2 \